MKRTAISILVATVVMGAFCVAGAAAHTVRYSSTITAMFMKAGKDPATFSGTVTSTVPRCQGTRKINLRLLAADGSSTVVASGYSDSAGAWTIQPSATVAPGNYVAEAAKKLLRKSDKHRHTCTKALSGQVAVK